MKTIYKILIITSLLVTFSCSEDTFETSGTGRITGTVVKKDTNEPIENVKISTNPSSSTVFTDSNGNFTLSGVTIGDYSIEASKEGLLTAFEGVTVIKDQSVSTIFEMLDNTTTNEPPTGLLLLTPNDNESNLPINVELTWEASDSDGDIINYTLELRNDSNSNVVTVENITEQLYNLSDLEYGTQYFWQIGANDGINETVWSGTRSFSTTSFPNHRYLFTRIMGNNHVIFSADIDDTDVTELEITATSENSWRPRKSNSANMVAFLRSVGGETHIFTMLPDGSNVNQVTNLVPVAGNDLDKVDFSWSGDGDKIIYPSFDKLYMINRDGSGLTMIYQTPSGDFITECDWSNDESLIALKTNNVNGYGVNIFTINLAGTVIDTILTGIAGAAGGLNFSIDKTKLLYTHDISGYEDSSGRQLNTHVFMYDFNTSTVTDVSEDKPAGFLDLDPRFSPNESEVLCTYTSNDGVSEKFTLIINLATLAQRSILFNNSCMPDWE